MTDRQKLQNPQNPLWGGRFAAGPDAVMEAINASVDFDQRLAAQDIAGSQAHCRMLMAQGIVSEADGQAILEGLDQVAAEIADGSFDFKRELEDVHLNIEARLREIIGPAAGRLHTARSRNDQVATDLRLWVRQACDGMEDALVGLQSALVERAEQHADTLMPGFTHLQTAQPVTFGHHMMAYFEMFGRDRGRLADCRRRLNECPLGAGALAGTSFAIDRDMTAHELGFAKPAANSMDAVSDRDFALEYLAALALVAVHLSRLGEEIVLWASPQFAFVTLPDALSTGSSIMPQKKNPDAAELTRAKAGRVIGALTGLLVTLKGLPLTYSKDLQEDKEPVFDASDSVALGLTAMTGMVAEMTVNEGPMAVAAGTGFSTATDLADWLVQNVDMPFREAHEVTGRIVRLAEDQGVTLDQLALEDLQTVAPALTKEVYAVLDPARALAGRSSAGGTAPERVREAVEVARRILADQAQ
ncbi:MAG: argininosuccinate lyase [Alphaproteobacteria bacterium]|jgi:argininosuccinate lyase|nr:argininosuccinate lyase [Rhodospirillaceae bacterium]MDP6405342.1 argininosuccinate lyase [Alphaproteobacteria bacterium]MDP6622288.1 argininosuccinate lyase [Alphaproteobacteria bacterium]|tara:strand:+ start:1564 stop:2982 length:1419 start_codon:yes stop_codon:yes gene_type:complete